MTEVKCPECGAPMRLRMTQKFRYGDGRPRRFWSCTRYPACKGIHGAHPNGEPLGIPADAETKRWRVKAHAVFDQIDMPRKERYLHLQRLMGLSKDEAHIGRFDIEQCKRLIQLLGGTPQ